MKLLATIASLIALISLPSCMQPRYQKKKAALPKAAFSFTPIETNIDVSFQEDTLRAQLDDIPTFVGSSFIFIDDISDQNQLSFGCSSQADIHTLKDFYLLEMENCGWQNIGSLELRDVALVFQKPQKICVIILDVQKDQTIVVIKMMKRKGE